MPKKESAKPAAPEKRDAFGAKVEPERTAGTDPFQRDPKAEKEREAEKFGSPFSE